MNNTPIPEKELQRAFLRLSRRCAAMLCGAMAESDTGPEIVEARLGEKSGYVQSYIARLIDGKETNIKLLSDIARGLECEVMVGARKLSLEIERYGGLEKQAEGRDT